MQKRTLFSRIDKQIIIREIIYRNRYKKNTPLYSLLSVKFNKSIVTHHLQFVQSITLNFSINRS